MEIPKKVPKTETLLPKPSHYRNILVTINGGSEPRWVNMSEFNKLLEKGLVDTATINGETKQYAKADEGDTTGSLDS